MTLLGQILDDMRWYRRIDEHRFLLTVLFNRHFVIVATHRVGHWARQPHWPGVGFVARRVWWCLDFIVSTVTGTVIQPGAIIGRRFSVHIARGLVIGNGARIGDDCVMQAAVRITNRANNRGEGMPTIEDGVRVGVGAVVMGGITVGAGSVIGANAVVIKDVPPGSLAVGVPAVIKRRRAEGEGPDPAALQTARAAIER